MPGQLLRETNPAQGYAPSLVPQHEDVNGDYKRTGEINPLPVSVEDGGAAAQVDIQYRKQKMVPTHAGVLITNGSTSFGTNVWIDTDGFNEIALTLINSVAGNTLFDVYWSHDNATIHGANYGQGNSAALAKGIVLPILARWVKISVGNNHTAPSTISAWTYLKV